MWTQSEMPFEKGTLSFCHYTLTSPTTNSARFSCRRNRGKLLPLPMLQRSAKTSTFIQLAILNIPTRHPLLSTISSTSLTRAKSRRHNSTPTQTSPGSSRPGSIVQQQGREEAVLDERGPAYATSSIPGSKRPIWPNFLCLKFFVFR